MTTTVKILADSTAKILANSEVRLTTFELTFPRFILAELNTHRMLSRNSASSRAIPTEAIINRVKTDPFIPVFNTRVKGMGVGEELEDQSQIFAQTVWINGRDGAVDTASDLIYCDKSRVNRLLEPFMWHTAIVTATDWENFFALRTDEGAQPEFRALALMMQDAYRVNEPKQLHTGQWHTPLIDPNERVTEYLDDETWAKVSVGRCARVSYLTHDGKRDPGADLALHDRLLENKHLSPFEHVATPFGYWEWAAIRRMQSSLWSADHLDSEYKKDIKRQMEYHGNLHGWHSLRTTIPNEHNASLGV